MDPHPQFPRLTPDHHRDTNSVDVKYNCIAWAAEDALHWWQPGVFWLPTDWPERDAGIGALEIAFRSLGYEDCGMNADLEGGFLKVALYAENTLIYTHAARQLPTGKWTSKLGEDIDIEHDSPDAVAGGIYGEVWQIMKRLISTPTLQA